MLGTAACDSVTGDCQLRPTPLLGSLGDSHDFGADNLTASSVTRPDWWQCWPKLSSCTYMYVASIYTIHAKGLASLTQCFGVEWVKLMYMYTHWLTQFTYMCSLLANTFTHFMIFLLTSLLSPVAINLQQSLHHSSIAAIATVSVRLIWLYSELQKSAYSYVLWMQFLHVLPFDWWNRRIPKVRFKNVLWVKPDPSSFQGWRDLHARVGNIQLAHTKSFVCCALTIL